MDKLKLSLVAGIAMVLSYAMAVTGTLSEPFLELGPLAITLPYVLGYGSLIFLVWLWTPLLEATVKFFMNGTVMKVMFFIVLIFGILATVDIIVNAVFGIDIGIISGIKGLWSANTISGSVRYEYYIC